MATPYVPVPIPIGSSTSFATNRNQRRSSLGSISTCSNYSKGQLEDSSNNSFKKMSVPDEIGATSSPCNSPLVRTKIIGMDTSMEYCTQPSENVEQNIDSGSWEDRPATPTILGYEVMEERAKFTVYKILVKKNPEENWVVFRRYTDFSRLNDKLKDMFPGFRLALPPKRWFKDNYNPDFLEDRQLGLQAFLQNLVAHKDIASCIAVREFLCLDDPPGPFDSLEESRAFCETLEETNYRLQKDLAEKQREVEALKKMLHEKDIYIDAMEKRIGWVEGKCLATWNPQRDTGNLFTHLKMSTGLYCSFPTFCLYKLSLQVKRFFGIASQIVQDLQLKMEMRDVLLHECAQRVGRMCGTL